MDGYTGGGIIGGGLATGGGLALTGANPVWAVLAGFALVAVGAAILRILPKIRPAGGPRLAYRGSSRLRPTLRPSVPQQPAGVGEATRVMPFE